MGLIGGIAKKELGESDLKNSKEIEKSLGEATTGKVTVKKSFKEILVFYTVPIVSILLFLAIVGFFVVPTVNGIYSNFNKVESLKKKKDADKPTLTSLVKLRDNDQQTQDDLAVVDKIVPSEKTKIVTLQKFIQDTVEKYGLTLKSYTIGEQLRPVSVGSDSSSGVRPSAASEASSSKPVKKTEDSLRVVPTTVKIEGKFSDIQKFFNEFYLLNSLFIVDSLNMKASQSIAPADLPTSEVKWNLDVTFAKYVFSEDFLTDEDVFNQLPASATPDQTTLDYIKKRFKDI